MKVFKEYLEALLHFVYPELCVSCNGDIPIRGDIFCLACKIDFSISAHFEIPNNDFIEKFYGRVPLNFGAALFNYYSGHQLKNMLHALKYRRQQFIGEVLGRYLGQELLNCPFFELPDCIIPVPMHSRKEQKRGYNQATIIARAISRAINVPLCLDVLKKIEVRKSQTKKNRFQRVNKLSESFELSKKLPKGHHILLIDDILTTGATLEACALTLLEKDDFVFSFATLAITKTK